MKKKVSQPSLKTRFVDHLPDLITEADYLEGEDKKKIRLRIKCDEDGVFILGDSMYPQLLEAILEQTDAEELERMLCG